MVYFPNLLDQLSKPNHLGRSLGDLDGQWPHLLWVILHVTPTPISLSLFLFFFFYLKKIIPVSLVEEGSRA